MSLEITIDDTQKVNVKINPTTDAGTAAKLDGVPVWTADGASIVVPAADGLSAFLVSADVAGDTTFTVSADADLGAGVTTITGSIILHVIDAQATNLGLSADAAIPKS